MDVETVAVLVLVATVGLVVWWAAGRSGGARRAETRLRHICARRARIKQRTLQRRKRANLQTPHHVAIRSEVSLSNGTQLCHRV